MGNCGSVPPPKAKSEKRALAAGAPPAPEPDQLDLAVTDMLAQYDKDGSGTISKDEVHWIFSEAVSYGSLTRCQLHTHTYTRT